MTKLQKAILAEVAQRYLAGQISKAELEAFMATVAKEKPTKKVESA